MRIVSVVFHGDVECPCADHAVIKSRWIALHSDADTGVAKTEVAAVPATRIEGKCNLFIFLKLLAILNGSIYNSNVKRQLRYAVKSNLENAQQNWIEKKNRNVLPGNLLL